MEVPTDVAESASPVKPHAESPRDTVMPTGADVSPSTPTKQSESDVAEVETEKSPAAERELHKTHEDGTESDKARTDSDDDEEEPVKQPSSPVELQEKSATPVEQHNMPVEPVEQPTTQVERPTASEEHPTTPVEQEDPATPIEQPTTPVEQPTTPVEQSTTPVQQPTTPVEQEEPATPKEQPTTPVGQPTAPVEQPTMPVEEQEEPTTPVGEYPIEQSFQEEEQVADVAQELMQPLSPVAMPAAIKEEEKMQIQQDYGVGVQTHEVELVIPSPKRPAPLNLVQHDIDDETSDSDEEEGGTAGGTAGEAEEGADLGTPLGYGGAADFGEGQDDFASHRFLGPSVASDSSSVRALHSIRHVALHDKPPRFSSEAPVVPASSGSLTSSGESSGRNSSSASHSHAPDAKSGLRSQSEADYMEHPLNTYALTFTEPVLGFNTNVVVSLENELLVEVWSVEKDSPAQRAGVVVGDYLITVNGQTIEPHMTKEQVFEIIQTSTVPRTLVFQRDVHDKDSQSKSLPDKKNSPAKPLMGRLGAAMSQGASIIGSKWKRKKTIVHANSFCDGCGMDPIAGALWTCSVCSNYNLCSECYDLGTHGMENTEQMQALSEAIVQYKLQKKCKHFTPEFLLSLRRDICKGRPDKFEYLGEWIANIVVGTSAAKITVRGIEIPSLPPASRQRFVSYLMPLVSNRTDIEVNIEWLPDDADHVNAAGRASVDRMSAGAYASGDEEGSDDVHDNLEKLRIWISDKKTRTTSPFA
ncbi:hypothetical protein PRIC1_013386 [Phytophthora ramorum]|uniref:PDZ domain-containing protein n=1 Tax=Phytophthora ramorum TaxID=164328 RepID=H3GBU0_PHYRM|nr:Zonadhesin [Phytophthora ramorum]